MERTVKTKFYTFSQNNSGGYFVQDEHAGVCEEVVVEAQSPEDAWSILHHIGENVSGFWEFCQCCGERWSEPWGDDGTESLVIDTKKTYFREKAFIHYYDGRIERIDFK